MDAGVNGFAEFTPAARGASAASGSVRSRDACPLRTRHQQPARERLDPGRKNSDAGQRHAAGNLFLRERRTQRRDYRVREQPFDHGLWQMHGCVPLPNSVPSEMNGAADQSSTPSRLATKTVRTFSSVSRANSNSAPRWFAGASELSDSNMNSRTDFGRRRAVLLLGSVREVWGETVWRGRCVLPAVVRLEPPADAASHLLLPEAQWQRDGEVVCYRSASTRR